MKVERVKHILSKIPSYMVETIFMLLLYPYANWKYAKSDIWLISERGDEARDNGMHLFKYIRKHYPKCNVYYVITRNSPDIENIFDYGNIIYKNSMKHRMFFYASQVLVSTHLMGGFTTNEGFYCNLFKYIWKPKKKKIVSIKHGITKDDLPVLYAENSNLDLLIAGAKPEYEYMLNNFHYSEQNLKYTGFARFDNLYDCNVRKQILLMPTWRTYLTNLSKSEFCDSDFFHNWSMVLNNEKLREIIEKKNIKLIFYPHYELQKYIEQFSASSKNIVFANSKEYDVQCLLKESALLVTDYSSVFFDFAYMEKPVVYFQFDKEKYRSEHYQKGYFDYEKMGFGDVIIDENNLVDTLINYINREFLVKEHYLSNMRNFFPLHDNHNCERIVNEIMAIVDEN